MAVAKGQSQPDGTYLYQCGQCKDRSALTGGLCTHCYGGSVEKITEALNSGVRGERYYALLKAFLRANGKAIVGEANRIKAANESGRMSVADCGYISLKFNLNFRATVEWLEETHCVKAGAYTQIMESKYSKTGKRMRVKDVYEAVWERHPELKRE